MGARSAREQASGECPWEREVDPVALVRDLRAWFARVRRDLPWREGEAGRRDPYLVLVSEVMLQQTQVARVAAKLPEFLRRFPTVRALALAPEDEVLGAWTGLGYYRRARLLHAAARHAVAHHDGEIPGDLAALRAMPGVGAYTAGAIASLAHGVATPAIDTNVSRVLLRVGGRDLAAGEARGAAWVRGASEALIGAAPRRKVGELNEALMELGALVCVARGPRCEECPIRAHCVAHATGRQHRIPRASRPARRSGVRHECLVVREGSRVLLQQRPREGLWGGLWQLPTRERTEVLETDPAKPSGRGAIDLARATGLMVARGRAGAGRRVEFVETFVFKTTHRDVRFVVWKWLGGGVAQAEGRWCSRDEALALGMSSPMRRLVDRFTRGR